MVLRTQSGWRVCAAGTGTRYKIKPIVFEVCTRDQACFRLFLYIWYRQHRGSYLDRVQQIPWNEILELWIFILDYFVSLAFCFPRLGLDIFAFTQQCLTKKLKGKAVDRFLSCFVSIQNKLWIQLQTSCLHQRLVFLALFRRYGGSHLFDRNSSLHRRSEFEQHMNSSDPRPDSVSLMQLKSRRAVPQVSRYPDNSPLSHMYSSDPRPDTVGEP